MGPRLRTASISIYSSKTQQYAQVGTAKDQNGHQIYNTFVRHTMSPSEDRPSRGQEKECSGPRTGMLEAKAKNQGRKRKCSPKKDFQKKILGDLQKKQKQKKIFKTFFQAISTKNDLEKIFLPIFKILTVQKIVLFSSRGQDNFRGLETSRPRT